MSAIVAQGLGRRFGKRWALEDCSLEIPTGRVAALVGPNGAGKTTLLHLAVGLLRPSTGTVTVLGEAPGRTMSRVGFVAQEMPLYRSFSVADIISMGRHLNPSWDGDFAHHRLAQLAIPLDQKVGNLSGGQRAQLALVVALAKRPELLLLDEPLASLDPLARHEFLQTLMESVADTGLTVVLSSHLIADMERVCDYILVLAAAHTQVAGDIDGLLARHRWLTGPVRTGANIAGVAQVVQQKVSERQTTLLVRTDGPIIDPAWTQDDVSLEDLVLGYLGSPGSSALPAPRIHENTVGASR